MKEREKEELRLGQIEVFERASETNAVATVNKRQERGGGYF